MKHFLYLSVLFLALFTVALLPLYALADSVSAQDIKVTVNSLKYIRGLKKSGEEQIVGAVYDPSNADSETEAKQFVELIRNSPEASKAGLKARIVPVDGLKKQQGMHLLYVSQGLSSQFPSIYAQAKENQAFTFSKDKSCVAAQCCVISVQTGAHMEIFLNEETLRELGFAIDAAFKFMTKRI